MINWLVYHFSHLMASLEAWRLGRLIERRHEQRRATVLEIVRRSDGRPLLPVGRGRFCRVQFVNVDKTGLRAVVRYDGQNRWGRAVRASSLRAVP